MNYNRKDLANLYGQVRGKEVPSRKHLEVLGERKFGVDDPQARRPPMGEYGPGTGDPYFTIFGKTIRDESDVKKLNLKKEIENRLIEALGGKSKEEIEEALRRIEKGVGYIAGTHQGEVLTNEAATAIRDLVKKSGFDNEQTYNFVKMVLQRYDLDDKLLAKLGTDIENKKVLTEAITEEPFGEVNLYDVMKPQLAFLENEEDRSRVYNEIFSKSFQEGTVGVGDGELAMSLFTEAFKGDVGDLKLPDGLNVEVKTGKARIISSRKGGFKKDRDKFEYLANKSNLSIDDFNMEYNFDLVAKTFQNTEQLKMFLEQDDGDAKTRIQHFGGLMLYEYGRDGNPEDPDSYEASKKGFDILLTVFQKGYKQGEIKGVPNPDRPARMEEGTFSLANYINVKDYANILAGVKSGLVKFLPEGDGIYIYYPGSNTSGAFKANYQVTI